MHTSTIMNNAKDDIDETCSMDGSTTRNILIGVSLSNKPLRTYRFKCEDNIKMYIKYNIKLWCGFCRVLVNTVMNNRVSRNIYNLLNV
jgi:hypothetical protein